MIVFGAHPDDCELLVGGLAAKYVALGHAVKFVSVTNGDAGHQLEGGGALARRRIEEAQRAGDVLGIEYEVLDHHDGELLPSLDARRDVIRAIRQWEADLVISHRPNDYHPDHRYTGMLIQDAAYMVTVPNVCPDEPALFRNPFFFYAWDHYRKPYPFQPDVAIAVDGEMDKKWDMVHCHTSQFYEWLPYLDDQLDQVPQTDEERRRWLPSAWDKWMLAMTECCRERLKERYGEPKASMIRYAETFEICEYGRQPTKKDLEKLFSL
jgi:LmbE family N-acetylglucosaminyl deacetylase